uniref:Uncharacterized protein n=1 Tax=Oryza meridionalis TaxID=40149 RepID=A0A0E0DWW7_9ORYZ
MPIRHDESDFDSPYSGDIPCSSIAPSPAANVRTRGDRNMARRFDATPAPGFRTISSAKRVK